LTHLAEIRERHEYDDKNYSPLTLGPTHKDRACLLKICEAQQAVVDAAKDDDYSALKKALAALEKGFEPISA